MYNKNGNWSEDEYLVTRNLSVTNEFARNNVILKRGMSVWQYRIFYTALSLIEWEDTEFGEFEIPVKTLYNMFSPDTNYHISVDDFKKLINEMAYQTFVFYEEAFNETMSETIYTLFEYIRINYTYSDNNQKTVKSISLKFSSHLLPFVTQLRNKQYVSIKLGYTIRFKLRHSFVLYPLLSSMVKLGRYKVPVDKLMKICRVTGRFSDFKRRNLDPAIKEINEKTNLNIIATPIKKGKATAFISFSIKEKTGQELLNVNLWQPEDFFEKEYYKIMDSNSKK